ncbi:uncharacterized protein [Callorhinus ursinus]|uniref:uncharacterized protein n=1 Tax=Callorhinus ursinus TaxID=34884 RepID=UPI003CD02C0F
MTRNPSPLGEEWGGGGDYYVTTSASPGQQTCKNGERRTRQRRLRPESAHAHGEAPPLAFPTSPRPALPPRRGARHKAAPAGTARGFRPEARRSPFGSGPSPALTRELSRSFNIRDQRLAPASISGKGHEGKDPVTPLPVPVVTQAPALGAAAPSGAASPAARGGGARTFLSEPSREIAAPAFLFLAPRKGGTRVSALPGSSAGGSMQPEEQKEK